ncbi:DUF7674 family protein [Hymenobacter weizhouensis]|uniref:DUF7674 family protein n=1 Tax=Hymenobacter sp. YIM 151500-1 TaxID=2987689 RepID=UPI002226E5DA|nr:hypothetical protein [Hymenobacter sp. YIM 151500-1]UYZ64741.1 hypothetical protein OIS53_07790 [Hymenobacter sp. YIM 151500-1]
MISPAETATYLLESLPELGPELQTPTTAASVYQQLGCFAAFTRTAAHQGRLALLRRCFETADHLLDRCDAGLSRAVENVYLHCLHLDGSTHHTQLARQLMPARLYRAYHAPHANMLP